MRMKKIMAIAMAAAAVLLCSCGKGKTEDSGAKAYNVPEFTPAGESREGAANIYLIVKSTSSSYFKVMFEAAKDAAAEFNCNVYYSGSESSSEWEAQAELMTIAAERGADAVILAPDDTVRLADKVKELYDRGIAVICVDAVINSDNYNVCYMTDNLAAGEQAAVEMLYHLRKSGLSENEAARIAIQTGRSSSQTVNERVAGFCQYWTENAPAKWEIIGDIKSNNGDSDKAVPLTAEYFAEYDNIRGLFGTNLVATRGLAVYVSQNEKKDVAVVGFDYCDELAALINDGSYMASVMLQKQYDMAYDGVKAALAIKAGTFSTDSKLMDTGVIAANHANLNDPDVKTAIERN